MPNNEFDNFIKATAQRSKKEGKKDNTTRVTFTLKKSLLDKIDKYSKASEQSRSESISDLIEDGFNYKMNNL